MHPDDPVRSKAAAGPQQHLITIFSSCRHLIANHPPTTPHTLKCASPALSTSQLIWAARSSLPLALPFIRRTHAGLIIVRCRYVLYPYVNLEAVFAHGQTEHLIAAHNYIGVVSLATIAGTLAGYEHSGLSDSAPS